MKPLIDNSIESIKNYLGTLRKIPNIKDTINYGLGVPIKYLTNEVLRNKNKLLKICNKHSHFPSELQQDIDNEIEYYLSLI